MKATITPAESEGYVNVVLHPVLFDDFVAWLDSRNCDLSPPIPADDETEETFRVVSPRLRPANPVEVDALLTELRRRGAEQ